MLHHKNVPDGTSEFLVDRRSKAKSALLGITGVFMRRNELDCPLPLPDLAAVRESVLSATEKLVKLAFDHGNKHASSLLEDAIMCFGNLFFAGQRNSLMFRVLTRL